MWLGIRAQYVPPFPTLSKLGVKALQSSERAFVFQVAPSEVDTVTCKPQFAAPVQSFNVALFVAVQTSSSLASVIEPSV